MYNMPSLHVVPTFRVEVYLDDNIRRLISSLHSGEWKYHVRGTQPCV